VENCPVPLASPLDWPVLLAGQWTATADVLEVRSPFDHSPVGRTWLGGAAEFARAAEAAVAARGVMRDWPLHARQRTLRKAAEDLRAGRSGFAQILSGETGKPLRDALVEVDRAAFTLEAAADEVSRMDGEVVPMDVAPHGEGRLALTRRVPLGPVAAITPFNFPLNLVAHKLAPALATGNPVVLKPATKTPLSALILARLLVDAGVPPGGLSVLPLERSAADRLVTDERFALLTFTGSAEAGWGMKARAGHKRVVLELGGNAAVIVDASANIDAAVKRVVAGGFTFAGQSCISVQRVYLHEDVADAFTDALVAAVSRMRVGDPSDPLTDVGPMITHADVDRIDTWVREAVAGGAAVLTGGHKVSASLYAPTVLSGIPATARVCAEEAFAPVVGLYRFTTMDEAIAAVNTSRYGLQAGIFTRDLPRALDAFRRLEVGGVVVNDVPSYRVDSMPYGGVKDSGTGREGPRYAMDAMTELKLLIINTQES